jgi:predicted lysophospholipase L1 biosynthesis ABC-type transport system permease subunit
MIKRFAFQVFLGFFCFICVVSFGQIGFVSFSLYALLALFRNQPDERELQIFYKTGNATMGLMILVLVAVHFLQDQTIANFRVGDHWLVITANVVPIIQGCVGIYLLKVSE